MAPPRTFRMRNRSTIRRSAPKTRSNPKNLKKTTAKGAYRKGVKRNFQKRRQPFVETKNQTDAIVAAKAGNLTGDPVDGIRLTTQPLLIHYSEPNPDNPAQTDPKELTIFPIQAFLNMNQGLQNSEMVGRAVYARYLKMKLEFQLPYGGNQIRHPCDMYLIHGFITQPLGLNEHTYPKALDFTRTQYKNHIDSHLRQYFNQRADKLDFIPKRTNNIKFLGYRKLKTQPKSNLGPPPVMSATGDGYTSATFQQGSHPLVNMTCTWPMKKKIYYTTGTSTIAALPFMYPNWSWIPFVALYNPTAHEFLSTVTYPGAAPATNNPPNMYVRYNSNFYFSDS